MSKNYTDNDLVKAIQKGGQSLNQAMNFIYKKGDFKESILSLIRKKNGSLQDAEDVFQDGIRHLIINVRSEKFEQKSYYTNYRYNTDIFQKSLPLTCWNFFWNYCFLYNFSLLRSCGGVWGGGRIVCSLHNPPPFNL